MLVPRIVLVALLGLLAASRVEAQEVVLSVAVSLKDAVEEIGRTSVVKALVDVGKLGERFASGLIIDRPAVVGIDEREIPQFVALVDVRRSG